MSKLTVIAVALALVMGFVVWKYSPFFSNQNNPNSPVTLQVWGLWDDDTPIRPSIEAYEKLHPNIHINYTHQNLINYRSRVQTQIGSGQGPDILVVHDTWIPMFLAKKALAAAPQSTFSPTTFAQAFYPVATKTLVSGGWVYGVPLEIDGLGMYVNTDLLQAAGVEVPSNWFQFIGDVPKLTQRDQTTGQIQIAGAALGSTNNIDFWPDIIGMLFAQQPQTSLENPGNAAGAQVLSFYTSFITDPSRKSWDISLDSSTQAFTEGKLAFYFAPFSQVAQIKQTNPNLHFKIAPVPQLPNDPAADWASFWSFGVSSSSQYKEESWDFLQYLTSHDSEENLLHQSLISGLPSMVFSRNDMKTEQKDDPYAGAFVSQSNIYYSWYLSSNTLDGSVNDDMISLFKKPIDDTLQGNDPESELQNITPSIQSILSSDIGAAPTSP